MELKYGTMLLVHMEDQFTTKLKSYFEDKGFTIVQVENIEQAYQVLGAQSVDIIIVDMEESYDSAFKFFYRVKRNKNFEGVVIVALSSAEERFSVLLKSETKDEKRWLNVDLFVNKPISPKNLYLLLKKEIAILEGIDATKLDTPNMNY
jgi:response regulator RpfG family c-di-GMP phosphodiesterase